MLKTLFKCAIASAVVVYLWYMFSWMILPWHSMILHEFTNQDAVARVIMNNAPVNGLYIAPSMQSSSANQQNMPGPETPGMTPQGHQMMGPQSMGPFLFVNVKREGMGTSMILPMVISFITQFIGAFIITLLLLQTKAMRYWHRVRFVTITGFLICFLSLVPIWNWWGFTGGYTLIGIIEGTIAWFLGGLVIARLVKN
jgi:hypothetical protein